MNPQPVTSPSSEWAISPAAPDPVQESNHRIANHLQLLTQMVTFEARRVRDPVARATLDSTLHRIAAIAHLHRQLHRIDSDRVDMAIYLDDLAGMLDQIGADPGSGRRVIVTANSVMAAPREASAIGMIVAELVSNALKHAYRPGEPGDIHVSLEGFPTGYRLEVRDRGRGMSGAASPCGHGLGVRLIATLSRQLGGEASWSDSRPGTLFSLSVAR